MWHCLLCSCSTCIADGGLPTVAFLKRTPFELEAALRGCETKVLDAEQVEPSIERLVGTIEVESQFPPWRRLRGPYIVCAIEPDLPFEQRFLMYHWRAGRSELSVSSVATSSQRSCLSLIRTLSNPVVPGHHHYQGSRQLTNRFCSGLENVAGASRKSRGQLSSCPAWKVPSASAMCPSLMWPPACSESGSSLRPCS